MPDVAIYMIRPPVRCFGLLKNSSRSRCGKAAEWHRQSGNGELLEFYCDDCRAPGDQPLRPDALFRRVSVFAEILFTGASTERTAAHAEVMARLESALAAIGAVLNVHGVSSNIGRTPLQARPGEAPRRAVRV